ncbi:MAG: TonB C-terminal domain-containing protein [Hydrogenophilus sp.]|nr:TonB C-terminal domain-containing protein [Hydrogenophilus sp.]
MSRRRGAPIAWAWGLSLLVHGVFLAVLLVSLEWRKVSPVSEAVLVEMVGASPMVGGEEPPKPEPPKPEPPQPEPPKPEPPKPQPPKPEPPKPQPPKPEPPKPEPPKPRETTEAMRNEEDFQRLASERLQERLRGGQSPRSAGGGSGPSAEARARYIEAIRSRVRRFMVVPPGVSGNLEARFVVTQLADGTVAEVRLIVSSGNPALDAAFARAIERASPLPLPDDPRLFERVLELRLRPGE